MQIVVVGMHRSGTSAVTRLLNMMGLSLGPADSIKGANPENPKGFWENDRIVDINKRLYEQQNCEWMHVSVFQPERCALPDTDKLVRTAQHEIIKLDLERPWATKDPRLCLTLPFWKPLLECPLAVLVHRDPLEIAHSLRTRSGIPSPVGLALWERHMTDALHSLQGIPVIFAPYREFLEDPVSATGRLYTALAEHGVRNLSMPSEREILAFISPELHRERSAEEETRASLTGAQAALSEALAKADPGLLENPPRMTEAAEEILAYFDRMVEPEEKERLESEVEALTHTHEAELARSVDLVQRLAEKSEELAESKELERRLSAKSEELARAHEAELARSVELEQRLAEKSEELARAHEIESARSAELKKQLTKRSEELNKVVKQARDDRARLRTDVARFYRTSRELLALMEHWNNNPWWRAGKMLRATVGALLRRREPRYPYDEARRKFNDTKTLYERQYGWVRPDGLPHGGETKRYFEAIGNCNRWLDSLRENHCHMQRLWWWRLGEFGYAVLRMAGQGYASDPRREADALMKSVEAWRKQAAKRYEKLPDNAETNAMLAKDLRELMNWIEAMYRFIERTENHFWWQWGLTLRRMAGTLRLKKRQFWMPTDSARKTMTRFRDWRRRCDLPLDDGAKPAEPTGSASALATPSPRSKTAPASLQATPSVAVRKSVDVVVCVHNALDDVQVCLDSIVRNTPQAHYHLIVVNDGSDDATTKFLRKFCHRHQATLLEASVAQRYTKAANRGLRASSANYVVLLNSDTVVPEGWLDRILACGESDPTIGILGPLSNAASYQSVPEVRDEGGDWSVNPLPAGYTVDDMARAVASLADKAYPRVPFVNGFCYVIKRTVIDAIGYLDEETFPNGYGEENDYSLRAAQAGFELALVDDGYVYHAKSKSYSHDARRQLSANSQKAIHGKHGEAVMRERVAELETASQRLDPLRDRLRELMAHPDHADAYRTGERFRVMFLLLDQASAGGGTNSIVQEVAGLRELDVWSEVAVHRSREGIMRSRFESLPQDLFYFYNDESQLLAHVGHFDVAVATHFKTMKYLRRAAQALPHIAPAYYIQDYEPLFVPENRPDLLDEARESYTALDGLVRFAKTDWIREQVKQHHHVDVRKVMPSLDGQIYCPRSRKRGTRDCIRIAAMVRPDTPKRAPKETMELLHDLTRRHGRRVAISIFGNDPDSKAFQALPRDFPFDNHGFLKREEVAELLADSDIFIDMSKFQGFGRTGLEAMAVGCAALLPRNGGVHEYAVHETNALIVDTEDMTACLEAADRLITDHGLRKRLVDAGLMTASRYNVRAAAISELLVLRQGLQEQLVTIVMPVYNAFEQTRACIESVLRNTGRPYSLVLVEDCSTDERVWPMICQYASDYAHITVVRNPSNAGFTKTVNRGCRMAEGDVVLLNSDTIVTPRWLDRLRAAAYGRSDVATVTPLSNAAGAFSVPENNAVNPLPSGVSPERVAEVVSRLSPRIRPEVPTGNGFCMYVTRKALDRVGLFDEDNFPRGYGEENDFCMRAKAAGFVNLVDDSTYIYHERSASYQDSKNELMAKSRERLRALHPTFKEEITAWLAADPLDEFRATLSEAIPALANGEQAATATAPTGLNMLYFLHQGGGGTRHTSDDLARMVAEHGTVHMLLAGLDNWELRRIHPDGDELVKSFQFGDTWAIDAPLAEGRLNALEEVQRLVQPEVVHIRHLLASHPGIIPYFKRHGARVIVSFHDFYTVCPTLQLVDHENKYCAGHCGSTEVDCRTSGTWFKSMPPLKNAYVRTWREATGPSLNCADAFVVTSSTTQAVIQDHYPFLEASRFHKIEHGRDFEGYTPCAVPPDPQKAMQVVLFGGIGTAKGLDLLPGLLEANEERGSPIHLHILGDTPLSLPHGRYACTLHGPYSRDELADRMAPLNPSVSIVPSIWPETFCHTLTESWALGIPVLGTALGAVGDRIRRHGGGWDLEPADGRAWLEKLATIREDKEDWAAKAAEINAMHLNTVPEMVAEYMQLYGAVQSKPVATAPRM